MGSIVQYSVNIAMEVAIILMLAVLLITCLWQKKYFSMTTPLVYLMSAIIITLFVQIATWMLLIYDAPARFGAMPMRVVYVLDYVFYYCVSIAFYFYVEALAINGYSQIGITYRSPLRIRIAICAWGVVSTLVYVVMLFIPSIFRIENGQEVFSIPAYVGMHIMAKFAVLCAIELIIHHRKVIGKREAMLCLIFSMLIFILVVVDELCGFCISYVLSSLFAIILYVNIDLQKGLLLERQEREITEWKTQIMLSQMQPHFLYNILTTISSLCEVQNALEARDVVNRFADYFRTNLDSLGKERTIPFEKELSHIKTYLWLEKVRFEDALNIRFDIGPTDFLVPSLAIQPMVENAVKHGILPEEDGGTVTLRTFETDREYVVVIEDDDVGFDVNEKRDTRNHVGIENVSKRLEIICSGVCEIHSEKGKGTVVLIHIPKGVL